MTQSGIYRWLCIPTGKRYIGQAEDLSGRYNEFTRFSTRYSSKSDNIRGIDAARKQYPDLKYWDYRILIECNKDWLNFWETKCITINQTKVNGYNLTRGGTTGTKGYKHTEITRKTLSKKQKSFQETVPADIRLQRAKYASSFVDRNNPEYRKHLSSALMGHKESEECKNKIRESQRKNMKPVVQLDLEGGFIKRYESRSEAARALMKTNSQKEYHNIRSSILRAIKRGGTAYDYKWKWAI